MCSDHSGQGGGGGKEGSPDMLLSFILLSEIRKMLRN